MFEFIFELTEFIFEYGVAVEIGLAVGELNVELELALRRFPFALPFALPAVSEQADTDSKALSPRVIINSLLISLPK